jgi:hypothetical protein
MSDKHQKALKRKKNLKQRAQKAASNSSQELFYEGNKFRSERYYPVMFMIELWICTIDQALALRGEPELVDGTIGKIYTNLIKQFRELGFAPPSKEAQIEFSWKRDFVEQAVGCLRSLVSKGASTHALSIREVIGILRTLNSSRVLWTRECIGGRGYIDYILEHVGYSEEEAENLAGEVVGLKHGSEVKGFDRRDESESRETFIR